MAIKSVHLTVSWLLIRWELIPSVAIWPQRQGIPGCCLLLLPILIALLPRQVLSTDPDVRSRLDPADALDIHRHVILLLDEAIAARGKP